MVLFSLDSLFPPLFGYVLKQKLKPILKYLKLTNKWELNSTLTAKTVSAVLNDWSFCVRLMRVEYDNQAI